MDNDGTVHSAAKRIRRKLILTVLACLGVSACSLSGSQPIGFQDRVNVGERMLASGEYESAYRLLGEVTQDNDSKADAHLSVADAYLRGDAFFKARNAFHQAIEKGATTVGQVGLGRVALAQNDPDTAVAKFDSVLAVDPANQAALNGRGVAFDLRGEHQLAIAEYHKVLEINPTNLDALNNLALSHTIGGLGHEAVAILQDLTQSELTDTNLRHNLAIAYYIVGRQQAGYTLATVDMSRAKAEQTFDAVRRYRASR
ncbi:MAG: tetratricopeptide repeat protein [Woeseiaceae bacterium]